MPPGGFYHGAAFGHAMADRFFAIDVLASLGRGDAGEGVPMIRRGDDDGIDVLAREQFPKINESGATFVSSVGRCAGIMILHHLQGGIAAGGIDIADCNHADFLALKATAHQAAALNSEADATYVNLAVRRCFGGADD